MDNLDSVLNQLHDIEGLDPISIWPLAIGWWLLISLGFLILAAFIYLVVRRLSFRRSWQYDAFLKLAALENNLSAHTACESVVILSDYLRRIVLQRFSRTECASLTGESWLKWLAQHDPADFDWTQKGKILLDAPYAPIDRKVSFEQIEELIQAIRNWVR